MVFQGSTEDSNQVEESHGALRSVLGAASITSDHFSLKNVLRQSFVSRARRSENNNAGRTYIWTIIRSFLFLSLLYPLSLSSLSLFPSPLFSSLLYAVIRRGNELQRTVGRLVNGRPLNCRYHAILSAGQFNAVQGPLFALPRGNVSDFFLPLAIRSGDTGRREAAEKSREEIRRRYGFTRGFVKGAD